LKREKELFEELSKRNLLTKEQQVQMIQAMRLKYIRKKCTEIKLVNSQEGVLAIAALAQLHENTKRAVKSTELSVKQKKALKAALTQDVTPAAAQDITGNSRWTIWRLKRKPPRELRPDETYEMGECSVVETKTEETVVGAVERMYCAFFENNTGVYSGSANGIRKMEIPKSTMACRLYAQLPRMYRELSASNPELLQNQEKSKSRLWKGIMEAKHRESDIGFNVELEERIRMDMAVSRYNKKLLDKRLATNRSIMPANLVKTPAEETHIYTELHYEMEDAIFPVADRTFYRVLKKYDMKYSLNAKPYVCHVCLDGPSDAAMLQDVLHSMGAIKLEQKQPKSSDGEANVNYMEQLRRKIADLSSVQQKLVAKQAEYKAHLRQFEVCRPFVDDQIKNLKPGECVLFRDFVNQYASDGVKIGNLQLVLLYRLEIGGLIRQLKVSNFNRRPTTDWYFVRDVMDFHLKGKANGGSGLFDLFLKIYISGDHGSHFSAIQNIYFESTIFELYSKTVLLLFLCSYHCYNRCDAAGVYSKKLSIAYARKKKVLVESADYAMALMADASCDTLGYDFKVINRSMLIIEGELKDPPKDVILRKMCEFVFFGPGVFKCRRVPGEGNFVFLDLRPTTDDSITFFCYYCSGEKQETTYHESEVCPNSVAERFKTEEDSVANNIDMKASPANDANRQLMLKGEQMNKKKQQRVKAEQRVRENPFPCKCCDLKRYKKTSGANKHMLEKHFLSRDDHRLYKVEPPKKGQGKKAKRKQKAIDPKQALGPEIEAEVGDEVVDDEEPEAGGEAEAVDAEERVVDQVLQIEPRVEATAVDAVKPGTRPRLARACNKGVIGIVEGSESEDTSESEESASATEQSEVESESEAESESESK